MFLWLINGSVVFWLKKKKEVKMITLGLRSSCLSFFVMLFFLLTVSSAYCAGPFSSQDNPVASLIDAKTLLLSGKTTYTVTVNPVVFGIVNGNVLSDVGNINIDCNGLSCGGQTVSEPLDKGATIVLTATLLAGTLVDWDGCAAAGGIYGGSSPVVTCTFTNLNENKVVGVNFLTLP